MRCSAFKMSNSHYGTGPPRPCVAGEQGWWKTLAFSTNLAFLPRKAAGDASHNANSCFKIGN